MRIQRQLPNCELTTLICLRWTAATSWVWEVDICTQVLMWAAKQLSFTVSIDLLIKYKRAGCFTPYSAFDLPLVRGLGGSEPLIQNT
jgi:hypothetical protein